ncbi:clasp N terminal-domain-containing protein, partial [Amylostereum chailletii]
DVDAKIDAVTKLQAEFESEVEITDADALIQALKACLRISNQHLQAATLNALPPLIPLILSHGASRPVAAAEPTSGPTSTSSAGSASVDLYHLRQVLSAFLSAGGIIDRLGDARERTREKARETLVLIGGFAFRGGGGSTLGRSRDGKAVETPLQTFERLMRENGLGSKVWRVREQSIISLVEIRRVHHLFPLRNYVTLLVGALEDGDSNVREIARGSVVELFTGPGVTDAARSDLKREMTKKNVRKTIVDSVLSRIFNGSTSAPASEGSENGDPKREYVPPSLALQGRRPTTSSDTAPGPSMSRAVSQSNVAQSSRPASRARVMTPPPLPPTADSSADVQAVYVASNRDLETEFASMFKSFEGKETEHNWASRDRSITRIRGMLKGGAHNRYADTFLAHLKPIADASVKTLASLRTTVAMNTISLYNEMAMTLGANMDSVAETLLTHLLRMAGFTKKITAQASQVSIGVILTYTSSPPRGVIPLLWATFQDKTPQARTFVVEHLRKYLELHGTRSKNAIEATGMFDILEKSVRKAVQDPNIGVRQSARPLFWAFHAEWPDNALVILNAQDSAGRKALEKANPNPETHGAQTAAAAVPSTKKTSVAAAIAASRAKARAIATAPPSLRHQATSAARTISPPKRSMSPSLSTGSISGPPTPPISPRSRIMSSSTRSVSNQMPPPSHSRTSSSDSNPSTSQRRPASPLVPPTLSPPRGSVIRRAMQTALPASPPATTVTPPSPAPRRLAPNRQPVDPTARTSVVLPSIGNYEEQSLLTAVAIPLPDDSDSDMEIDDSFNRISFSSPYERYPPAPRSASTSQNSFSPKSNGFNPMLSTGSPPAGVPQPIVEDVLRARAEQAQSAAERLLELVEPEDEGMHSPHMTSSLLLQNHRPKMQGSPARPKNAIRAPVTPANRVPSSVWRQAAAFQDSPAYNGTSTLLTDVLKPVAPQNDSGWWRKRMVLANQRKSLRTMDRATDSAQLQEFIAALNEGTADVETLKSTALFCISHPSVDPISPLSSSLSMPASPSPLLSNAAHLGLLKSDVWTTSKNFDRLFDALEKFLQPDKELELLEYGLIALWEMLEYLPSPMEGHESDVFAILLRARYSNQQSILDASNTIRDALTARIDPVYGLTTLHATVLAFLAEPAPETTHTDTKAGTHAYALIALGKFVLRLPGEILEDELPRLKTTLISALNDTTSLVVREAAASAIIAAQLVLRDETHLFALLDGLADEKKNLLTYLFDKHGARGAGGAGTGMDRLEREMRRLDGRTGTPPRPVATAP